MHMFKFATAAARRLVTSRAPLFFGALLAPVLVLVVMIVALATQHYIDQLEEATRAETLQTLQYVDHEIEAHFRLLEALASSEALDAGEIERFYGQAKRVQALEPLWRTVILSDIDGRRIFSTRHPFGTELGPVVQRHTHDAVVKSGKRTVGDITGEGPILKERLVPLSVPVLRGGAVRYVLTAAWSPEGLGASLRRYLPENWTAVVIGPFGRIITRTSDGAKLAGQLASQAARDAVAAGRDGEFRLSHSRNGTEFAAMFYRSPLSGWTIHVGWPYSTLAILKNRSVVFAVAGGLLVIVSAGLLSLLLYRDIRARRALEAQRAHAQRIEAIGELTGGVAHDFNNLLMVITGNLGLALKNGDHPKTRRRLELALEAASRGAGLTKQLLAFARRAPLQPKVLDLSGHLHQIRPLFTSSLRGDIAVKMEIPADVWRIEVDPQQLDLALVNLAVNARDAMQDGGVLRLSARNAHLSGEAHGHNPAIAGEFVCLSVSDTGMGMNPEALHRAFEPFFTTKEQGKGTGLGLSQVYGFAKQSGGTAQIISRVGAGTTVTIYLPRSDKEAHDPAARITGEAEPKKALHILLVEDDPAVAETTEGMLQQLGHHVTVLDRAEKALQQLAQRDAAYDLVLSDVVMPGGMDGRELAIRVRDIPSGPPVLLATGFASVLGQNATGCRILAKPFHSGSLEEAIQACIEQENVRRPDTPVAS